MSNKIRGIHHLTAITSSSPKIWDFFSNILGLHLIKKTVNQDDVRTYHLYFTDDMGEAGSVLTFFDFPGIPKSYHGTDEISKTTFRIPSDSSFDYWKKRFDKNNIRYEEVTDLFGYKFMNFYDFDDQRYALVSEEGNKQTNDSTKAHTPWKGSDVDEKHAIIGLGPEFLTVNAEDGLSTLLTKFMGAKEIAKEGDQRLFEFDNGGLGAEVITTFSRIAPQGTQGFGGVHHLAFMVDGEPELREWIQKIRDVGIKDSGFVDRFYFKSEYFKPTPGMLFEIATNGPGFLLDETYEEAGHNLELPPFLEEQREEIEKNLVDFNS